MHKTMPDASAMDLRLVPRVLRNACSAKRWRGAIGKRSQCGGGLRRRWDFGYLVGDRGGREARRPRADRYADTAALLEALGGGWWNRSDVGIPDKGAAADGRRPEEAKR
jgi:hypothetical protein